MDGKASGMGALVHAPELSIFAAQLLVFSHE